MLKGVDAPGRLRHAADLPRLALRQRLQPLRPHLAGDRPGRRRSSATRSTTSSRLKVRNADGTMVPLGAAGRRPRDQRAAGPDPLQHVPRRVDQRQRRAGRQLGRGDRRRWRSWPTTSCPQSMAYEWTELAYLELQAGNTAMIIFGFAVVMVFLVLAAQYESWSLPLAVILVVPMCLLSAIIGVQVGEAGHQHLHADRLRGAGRPGEQERDPDRRVRQASAASRASRAAQATLEACRLRLRPIVMTSFAFILGVRAAAARPRGRGRDAADAGDDRLQRHARRDALRHLPDAGVLLRDRLAGRDARLRARRRSGASADGRRSGDPDARRPAAIVRWSRRGSRGRGAGRGPRPSRRPRAELPEPSRPSRASSSSRSETIPMFSKFFIDRPIFASVLSIIITLAGGIAVCHAAGRAVSRDHAADGRGLGRTIPAPTPRSSPTPSPRRSSSRSTASRT